MERGPAIRSAGILVAVTASVVVTFLVATIAAEHHASNITARVGDIAGNAMPSVQLLSRARGAVMKIIVDMDEIDAHPERVAALLSEIRSNEEEIRASVAVYVALPFFPAERSLAEPLHAAVPAFVEAVRTLLDRATSRGGVMAPNIDDDVVRLARQRALELDASLGRLVEFDASQGQRLGLEILAARSAARALLIIFDCIAVALAILATFLATRFLQRMLAGLHQSRVHAEHRASEFERRTQELDQFSGRVAHDLLGPMSIAAIALETARRGYPDDAKLVRLAGRGLTALERVRAMVDALLRLARAGARPEPGAHTEICALVSDLVDGLTSESEAAHVELELEPLPRVEVTCSPGVLMSILGNLARNAIKHMGSSEVRRVTLRAIQASSEVVRFEVEDTGPGVPEHMRSRIFEPYFQGGADTVGIGLGLATVERLVQAHGGRVGVRSAVPHGSVFWFELSIATTFPPIATAPAKHPTA
jgi:signal transduction histidine kinase